MVWTSSVAIVVLGQVIWLVLPGMSTTFSSTNEGMSRRKRQLFRRIGVTEGRRLRNRLAIVWGTYPIQGTSAGGNIDSGACGTSEKGYTGGG